MFKLHSTGRNPFAQLLHFGVTCCHSQVSRSVDYNNSVQRWPSSSHHSELTWFSNGAMAVPQKKPYPQKLAEHHNQQHLFPICSIAEGWVLHLVGKKYSLLYL